MHLNVRLSPKQLPLSAVRLSEHTQAFEVVAAGADSAEGAWIATDTLHDGKSGSAASLG